MNVAEVLEPNASETSWWQASDGKWYPPRDGKEYGIPQFRYPWEYQDPEGRELGTVRDTSTVVLLSLVTLGVYFLCWQYSSFRELKRYSGEGLGGGLGLFLAFLFGIVTAFVLASEVGQLYARENQQQPVSVTTGFWHLIPFVGWVVWMIKLQRSLNSYWESHRWMPED